MKIRNASVVNRPSWCWWLLLLFSSLMVQPIHWTRVRRMKTSISLLVHMLNLMFVCQILNIYSKKQTIFCLIIWLWLDWNPVKCEQETEYVNIKEETFKMQLEKALVSDFGTKYTNIVAFCWFDNMQSFRFLVSLLCCIFFWRSTSILFMSDSSKFQSQLFSIPQFLGCVD